MKPPAPLAIRARRSLGVVGAGVSRMRAEVLALKRRGQRRRLLGRAIDHDQAIDAALRPHRLGQGLDPEGEDAGLR